MVIVVNWVAVISAEFFQALFISDFENLRWSIAVSLPELLCHSGTLGLTCYTAEFAPLLCGAGLWLTHVVVAGKYLWSSHWFVSLVCFPRWFLWPAFSLFESWSNIHNCWFCNTHHIQEGASHGESFSPFPASPFDKSLFLCHLGLLHSHFFFSL